MKNLTEIQTKVTVQLSQGRVKHTMGVAQTAKQMAQQFGADLQKAELAGWLHDFAKEYKSAHLLKLAEEFNLTLDPVDRLAPHLLHARVGACLAEKEFEITDSEILSAISSHTLGHQNMGLLEQIIFIADAIEPNRPNVFAEPIRLALQNEGLNAAIVEACKLTIQEVIQKSFVLHPLTVQTYNFYLLKQT